jgi:hypothetical protein
MPTRWRWPPESASALEHGERAGDVLRRVAAQQRGHEADRTQSPRQQVLHHGQSIHQVELLEDHADAAPGLTQFARRQADDVGGAETDAPGRRLDQPVDAADERALARTGSADDGNDLGPVDGEADAVQRPGSAGIDLGQRFDRQQRNRRALVGRQPRRNSGHRATRPCC